MRFRFIIGAAAGLLVFLAGCSSVPVEQDEAQSAPSIDLRAPIDQTGDGRPVESSPVTDNEPGSRFELIEGSGSFIDEDAARRDLGPELGDGQVIFNFEGESLQEVVAAILGDVLQENYVISPGISGNVTFSTSKPVRRDQVMPILEMLLSWNNASLVYFDNRYHVVPTSRAIQGQLTPTIGPFEGQRGYEVRVFPLDYIAPSEMEKLLKPYAKEGAFISIDNARGMLVLAGTRQELENYTRTIDIFDVDWLAGMSVGLFPVERVEADTVATELDTIFGESAGTPLAGMFRFLPIERLNAVLVITTQPEYLGKAAEWVERLDRGGGEAGARLYVYAVRNVKATDLADTLNDIFGTSGSSRRSGQRQGTDPFAPGIETGEITSINERRRNRQEQRQSQNQSQGQNTGGQTQSSGNSGDGGVALVNGDEIRITSVEETNSLLVRSTPQQYEAVLSAIKRLDVVPLQVLVEVQILEVTLTDSLRYGVQWFFENGINSSSLSGFFGESPTAGDSKGLFDSDAAVNENRFATVGSSGLTYALRGGDTAAVVSLLETQTDVQTLAAPSMMVLNNREANINVGTQIPVNSPVFNTGAGNDLATNRVQFRDTGVTLNVLPRVNPGGMVFLEISQEVSNPIADSADPNGNVAVSQRRFDTEVAVQSGEAIVMGGLIQVNTNESKRGLPVLSRIPFVGGLFGTQGEDFTRTELLVLITPTVVSSIEEARDVSREYQRRMRSIKPLDIPATSESGN